MLLKVLIVAASLGLLVALLFPKRLPRLLARLGTAAGRAGRLGRELATGREEPDSPLARIEVEAGEVLLQRQLSQHPVCPDARIREGTAAVGARLAAAAARRQIPYRFEVIESDEPNAFALPGGAVLITRPLVELTGGEVDLLAGVLGHEIAHIDQRHSLERLTASFAARAGSRALGLASGVLLGQATRLLEKLVVEGYHREQELQADLEGARLARRAGYDPSGLARLLDRLRQEHPGEGMPLWQVFQYFRSHPPIETRLRHLRRRFGS